MKPMPNTRFSTRLSGSARETEGRLKGLLKKHRRPPVILLAALALLIALCGSLVACQPGAEDDPAPGPTGTPAPTGPAETPVQPLDPPADAVASAAVPGTGYLLYLRPEGDGLALCWTHPDWGGGQESLLLQLDPASSAFPYDPGSTPTLTPFDDVLGRPGVVLGTTTDSGVPVQWYYRGDDYGVQLMAAALGETWTAQLDSGAEELLCLSGDRTLELWSRRDNGLLVYTPVSQLAGRLFPDAGGQEVHFAPVLHGEGPADLFDARYTGTDGREVTRQVSGEVLTQSLWPALSVSTPTGDTAFFWGEGEDFSSVALSVRTPDGTVRQLLEYFLDPGHAQLPLHLENLGLAPETELFATVTDDPVVRATYFDNGVVNHAFWAVDDRGEPVQLALLDDSYFHADLNGDGRDEVFSLAADSRTPEGQYLFFYLYTYPEEGGVRFASPPDVLAGSQGADHYDYTAGGGGLAQLYVEYDPEAQRFSFFHMDTGQPAARFTGRELYDFITEQGMWADGYIPVSGDFGRAAA